MSAKYNRWILLFFSVFLSVMLLAALSGGWGQKSNAEMAGKALGLDLSGGEELSHYDTHGGVHGDGVTCTVFRFAGDALLRSIESDPAWSAFPMDETAQTVLYGAAYQGGRRGPFLSAAAPRRLVPEIQTGYYRLMDRQKGQSKPILERGSFNLTLGIYDADSRTLYYCKLDT